MANILVVDDEHGIRDLLSEILNDEGHSVDLAENATQARAARSAGKPLAASRAAPSSTATPPSAHGSHGETP